MVTDLNLHNAQRRPWAGGRTAGAAGFGVSPILTSGQRSFSSSLIPEVGSIVHGKNALNRTSMNTWGDPKVVDAVKATGRNARVLAVAIQERFRQQCIQRGREVRPRPADGGAGIARRLGGACGLGMTYAKAIFGTSEGH